MYDAVEPSEDKEMRSYVLVGVMLASLLLMLSIGMAQTEENNTTVPVNNSTEINATLPGNASIIDEQSEPAAEAPEKTSESSSSSC